MERSTVKLGRFEPDRKYFYHATFTPNVSSILETGLDKEAPRIWEKQSHSDLIYVATTPQDSAWWMIVWYAENSPVQYPNMTDFDDVYDAMGTLSLKQVNDLNLWGVDHINDGITVLILDLFDFPVYESPLGFPDEAVSFDNIPPDRIKVLYEIPPKDIEPIVRKQILTHSKAGRKQMISIRREIKRVMANIYKSK